VGWGGCQDAAAVFAGDRRRSEGQWWTGGGAARWRAGPVGWPAPEVDEEAAGNNDLYPNRCQNRWTHGARRRGLRARQTHDGSRDSVVLPNGRAGCPRTVFPVVRTHMSHHEEKQTTSSRNGINGPGSN
jgi:hypothetical protein